MKKILVPVDGSAASLKAAAEAFKIARKYDSEVVIFHVFIESDIDMYNKFGVVIDPAMSKMKNKLKDNENKLLDSVINNLDSSGITFKKKIVSGVAYEEILKEGTILIISEEEAEKVNSSTSKKTIESLTDKNFNDNIKPANSNKKPVDNSKKIDNNKLYTVKAGDNLSKIAAENNCSINDIKKWNNLKDDKVMIGQVLNMDSISGNVKIKNEKNIEKTSNSNKTTKQKTKSYIVKKGDTLYDIAKKFDTSVSEIIKNNSTLDADKLQIGQKIKIK